MHCRPAPHLESRLVMIKGFADDPDGFVLALRRQIARVPGTLRSTLRMSPHGLDVDQIGCS